MLKEKSLNKTKLLAFLLAMILSFSFILTLGFRGEDLNVNAAPVKSGTYETCNWEIDSNGLLRIWPTNGVSGSLSNPTVNPLQFPWNSSANRTSVYKVKIDKGVNAYGSLYGMFYYLSNCTEMDLSGLDTSSVTNMSSMFDSCSSLTGLDLSNFDTTKVSNFDRMFRGCNNLSSVKFGKNWSTSSATTTSYMFYDCQNLANLDLKTWNVDSVTNMSYMFYNFGRKVESVSIDLTGWNTGKVTNMSYMFYGVGGEEAKTVILSGVSNFNTKAVTNMSAMFRGVQGGLLAADFTLDLSKWDTSEVKDMSYMFNGIAHNTNTFNLNLSNWNTSKVQSMSGMFTSAGYSASVWSITGLDNWNVSKVTNMSEMFKSAGHNTNKFNLDLSKWNVGEVTSMANMFAEVGYGATDWTIGDLSKWNTGKVQNMRSAFSKAGNSAPIWSIGDLSKWNTSAVTNMSAMFEYTGGTASTYSIGDISKWDVREVTDMSYMFRYAGYKATNFNLNLKDWKAFKVQSTVYMFYGTGLESQSFEVDLTGFDSSSVTNMSGMFYGSGPVATTWTVKGLNNLDVSSVTDMDSVFKNAAQSATSLNLDLSSWDVSSVKYMRYVFDGTGTGANSFKLDLSGWDNSAATTITDMFANAPNLTQVKFGENFKIAGTDFDSTGDGWIKLRNADGRKTNDKTTYTGAQIQALNNTSTPSLSGLWVKSYEGDEYITHPDGSIEYISNDIDWEIVSDTVWKYTFNVFDDSLAFKLFEEFMENYESAAMQPYYIEVIDNQAVITNKLTSNKYGRLEISKIVEGNSATNDSFEFTIILSGIDVSGTKIFNNVVFENGMGKFVLKDNETKVFELPVGTEYVVSERNYIQYSGSIVNGEGKVEEDEVQRVIVTNTYLNAPQDEHDKVNITLKKTLSGRCDESTEFYFSGYFTNLEPNTKYWISDGNFLESNEKGIALYDTILKHQDEIVFFDLPAGATYQFTEHENECVGSVKIENVAGTDTILKQNVDGTKTKSSTSTVTETILEGEDIVVHFHNKGESMQDLTIVKNVKEEKENGSFENYVTDELFEFTITFSNIKNDESFSSDIGKIVGDEDGESVKTFYLKNGESVKFYDIPVGVKYQVTESANDYKATYEVSGLTVAKESDYSMRDELSTAVETVEDNESGVVTFNNLKIIVPDKHIRLEKSVDTQGFDGILDVLTNNEMYQLGGAEYQIIVDGEVVETLITNENGVAISTNAYPDGTTGIIKETKAPSGFLVDEEEHRFTINSYEEKEHCEIEVSDVPTFDPAFIQIKKTDSATGSAQGDATFEGAVFKYEYFDNLDWAGTPTRTWYFATDSNGMHMYHPDYLADGYESAELYKPFGEYVIPLGSVKITEVVAPAGYKVMPVMYATITQSSSGAPAKWTYTQETLAFLKAGLNGLYEGDEPIDEAKFGKLTIHKVKEATILSLPISESSFEGCEFTVYNLSANSVKIGNKVVEPNGVCMVLTTGADGIASTDYVFPIGMYGVRETKGNDFYYCNTEWAYTFEVDGLTDNAYFETECVNEEIPEVAIQKVDGDGNVLAGASLQVKDSEGTVIAEWISTQEAFKVRLMEGTYVLHEVQPPEGYYLAEDVEFTVTNNTLNRVTMTDLWIPLPAGLTIQKLDMNTNTATPAEGATFEGCEFTVYNKSENSVQVGDKTVAPNGVCMTLTVGADGRISTEKVFPVGTYEIKETKGNDFYYCNTEWSQTFVVDGRESVQFTFECANLEIPEVEIQKLDNKGNPLAGAKLQIKDSEDKVIAEWISTVESFKIRLKEGNYILHEVQAPEGYYLAEDVEFTVNNNESNQVTMTDVKIPLPASLAIQKIDEITEAETPVEGGTFEGCEFTVYNKSDSAVTIGDKVVEPNEVCIILEIGADGKATTDYIFPVGTYEVRETKGNDFYYCNTDWSYTFTVDGEESVQFATEAPNTLIPEVVISKVDEANNVLVGAKLQLKDANGKVIAEWTSTTEDFKIRLVEGNYVLHEVEAPAGYYLAEDVAFTVTNNTVNRVTMTDIKIPLPAGLIIQKLDAATNSNAPVEGGTFEGCEFTVYNKSDVAVTIGDKTIEPDGVCAVLTIGADGKAVTDYIFPVGSYEVKETKDNDFYYCNDEWTYSFTVDGKEEVQFDAVCSNTAIPEVTISKVDEYGNKIAGAKLQILDSENKVVAEWISTTEDFAIRLTQGTYVLHEVEAPEGYYLAEDIEFIVKNNEPNQVTMTDVMIPLPAGLIIQKLDAATNISKPVEGGTFEGCEFTIYNKSGVAVKLEDGTIVQPDGICMVVTVNAEGKVIIDKAFPVGSYEVRETKGNEFYSCNTEWTYKFTVNGREANAFYTECANSEIPEVTISKVDGNGKSLEGAQLQIKDANGKVIVEWTSTGEDFKIRLPEGTYTLHEKRAPYGYTKAEDIEFTVTKDGENHITMVDIERLNLPKVGGEGIIKIVVLSIVLGGVAGTLVFLAKKKAREEEADTEDKNDTKTNE